MIRKGLTHAAINPRHVHQVLFVMFAAIVTLLIVQQYQHWNENHAVSAAPIHGSIGQRSSSVQASTVAERVPALQQVEQIERRAVDDTAQPHWVF